MQKNILKTQDIKEIDDIIKATVAISVLNDKLCDLEKRNEKDSIEYKKTLDYLTIALEVEKRMYSKANLSLEKAQLFSNFLLGTKFSFKHNSDIEDILSLNCTDRVTRRVLRMLSDIIDSHTEDVTNICIPMDLNDFAFINIYHLRGQLLKKQNLTILKKSFENDKLNDFLLFLQDFINATTNREIRDTLIEAKFNAIFIYEDTEESLYSLEKHAFKNSEFLFQAQEIDPQLYIDLKSGYAGIEAMNQTLGISAIDNLDYNSPKRCVESILRQCLLRSDLLMVDDNTATRLKIEFIELMEDTENFTISTDLVIKCFDLASKERNKKLIFEVPLL